MVWYGMVCMYISLYIIHVFQQKCTKNSMHLAVANSPELWKIYEHFGMGKTRWPIRNGKAGFHLIYRTLAGLRYPYPSAPNTM